MLGGARGSGKRAWRLDGVHFFMIFVFLSFRVSPSSSWRSEDIPRRLPERPWTSPGPPKWPKMVSPIWGPTLLKALFYNLLCLSSMMSLPSSTRCSLSPPQPPSPLAPADKTFASCTGRRIPEGITISLLFWLCVSCPGGCLISRPPTILSQN